MALAPVLLLSLFVSIPRSTALVPSAILRLPDRSSLVLIQSLKVFPMAIHSSLGFLPAVVRFPVFVLSLEGESFTGFL